MISPFEIYLIMQLDSVKLFLCFMSVASFFLLIVALAGHEDRCIYEGTRKIFKGILSKWYLAVILWSVTALMPTTQTAAAVLIVPALTSNEVVDTVQPEVKELYELAKKALQNTVEKEEEK